MTELSDLAPKEMGLSPEPTEPPSPRFDEGRLDEGRLDALIVCIGRTDIRQSGVEQMNRALRSQLDQSGVRHEWLDWENYTQTNRRGFFSFGGVRGAISTITHLAATCWRNRRTGTVVYFPLSQQGWGLARDIVTAVVALATGGPRRSTIIHLHCEFRPELQPRPWLARFCYALLARMPHTSFAANVRGLRFGGAESSFVPNRPQLPAAARQARELPKSIDPTVVFLGFVGPSKGFHVLMQAFEGLSVPAKLVVVGPVFESLPIYEQRFCSAQEWQRVLSVMRGDERVESVGPIYGDERFSYLRRAWVCAVPSFTEGGCLVLQEALAVGTQVVATRVGPLPEMLDESPGHRLVEANDPIGLRAAIEQCLEAGATEPLGVSETYLAGGTTAFELLAKESRRTPAQTLAGRRGKRVLSRTGSR